MPLKWKFPLSATVDFGGFAGIIGLSSAFTESWLQDLN